MSDAKMLSTPVPPGGTIGILGGGQLGRMLAMAAARVGLKAHIYSDVADAPAFQVCDAHTVAAYEDEAALAKFAKAVKHPKMGLPPPEVREGSGLGAAADETNGAGL